MKTQTIKIKVSNGREVVKGNGEHYRLRLASGEIVEGRMKPTFGYKLRRFCRRLRRCVIRRIDMMPIYSPIYYEPPLMAAEIPYIGLEE